MNYLDFNPSSRPTAMGSKGMATSAQPLASLAGINVLNKGGNAFDAIVAIASTLNVAEPFMSGMGGVGFGIDRIVMLLTGQSTIRDVIFFPTMRTES